MADHEVIHVDFKARKIIEKTIKYSWPLPLPALLYFAWINFFTH